MNYEVAQFSLGSVSVSNEKAGEALRVFKDVLRSFRDHGPRESELMRVKQAALASHPFQYESLGSTSSTLLGMMLANFPPDSHKQRAARIEAVTLDQIKALAKRLIDPDTLLVVLAGKPFGMQ